MKSAVEGYNRQKWERGFVYMHVHIHTRMGKIISLRSVATVEDKHGYDRNSHAHTLSLTHTFIHSLTHTKRT